MPLVYGFESRLAHKKSVHHRLIFLFFNTDTDMKVLIVEDEMMARRSLERLLCNNFPELEIAGATSSIQETVTWLATRGNHADIIFMDVELSDGICFEIFRNIEVKAHVIMTTAYDNYAVKAFETGSVDYLLKPIDLQSLKRAIQRCMKEPVSQPVTLAGPVGTDLPKKTRERFIVRFNDRIIPIQTSEIAFFNSEDKNSFLTTSEGHKYIIDYSLDEIAAELDPVRFFRISRSCIVAMSAIRSIIKLPGSRLKIETRPEAPFEMSVSRSRVDDFLNWI